MWSEMHGCCIIDTISEPARRIRVRLLDGEKIRSDSMICHLDMRAEQKFTFSIVNYLFGSPMMNYQSCAQVPVTITMKSN